MVCTKWFLIMYETSFQRMVDIINLVNYVKKGNITNHTVEFLSRWVYHNGKENEIITWYLLDINTVRKPRKPN